MKIQNFLEHASDHPKSVDLSGEAINEETARRITNGLRGNHNLRSINLSNCQLTDHAFRILAPSLQRVRHLDLSHNQLTHSILYDVVNLRNERPGRLRSLNLSHNQLSDRGLLFQGESLLVVMSHRHPRIRELDLSGNTITDQGIRGLFNTRTEKQIQIQLNLQDNQITNVGLRTLLLALNRAPAFRDSYFDLRENNTTETALNIVQVSGINNVKVSDPMLSMLMGSHERVGQDSSVGNFTNHKLFDANVLKHVGQFFDGRKPDFKDGGNSKNESEPSESKMKTH